MSENNDQNFEERLRKVVETVDVANLLTVPLTDSIENLLEISARSMNSEEASVLIRDGDEGDLRFLCVIGQVAHQIKGMKLPAGKGIAGFVFSSGQPMTVSNAEEEESFYAEVDKQTGYSTQTILATPLQYEGNIIGVLEYVNRVGRPPYQPFTPEEMDTAAIYAVSIASLVNAYESTKVFTELGNEMLASDETLSVEEFQEWLESVRATTDHKEMIKLAVLVRELAMRGKSERKLCKEILESILSYSDNNTDIKFSSL